MSMYFGSVLSSLKDFSTINKRSLLAEISKTFDFLGFVAPFTIRAKMFMERVWQEVGS